MLDNLDNVSLDELFKEARRALHSQKATPGAQAKSKASEAPLEDPYHSSAWVKTRGVALIHEETHTVIGNFTEYTNKHIPGARRLVRELEVPAVRVVEYVTGVWGEPNAAVTEPVRSRIVEGSRTAEVSLDLVCMKVQSEGACVKAIFQNGTLTRVELTQDTSFASTSPAEYFHLICLPAGTNVLREMGQRSITNLLETLGQSV